MSAKRDKQWITQVDVRPIFIRYQLSILSLEEPRVIRRRCGVEYIRDKFDILNIEMKFTTRFFTFWGIWSYKVLKEEMPFSWLFWQWIFPTCIHYLRHSTTKIKGVVKSQLNWSPLSKISEIRDPPSEVYSKLRILSHNGSKGGYHQKKTIRIKTRLLLIKP